MSDGWQRLIYSEGRSMAVRAILMAILCLFIATNVFAAVKVEKTEYKNWVNCYRVTSGEIELVVTGRKTR
jgi:hypothetical protein